MKKRFSLSLKRNCNECADSSVRCSYIRFLGLLMAFMVLAAFSVKDLNFDFGESQFSPAPDGQVTFLLPLYIDNRGY